MAIDPVCGMNVDEDSAQWHSEHQGETYYFCSPGCQKSFEAEPEKFLDGDDMEGSNHPHHNM